MKNPLFVSWPRIRVDEGATQCTPSCKIPEFSGTPNDETLEDFLHFEQSRALDWLEQDSDYRRLSSFELRRALASDLNYLFLTLLSFPHSGPAAPSVSLFAPSLSRPVLPE